MSEIDWTKNQTIRSAYKVENWHDGGFTYHERHGVFYMPQDSTVDFRPLYKLTVQQLGSFENAKGVIKDNLFWVKSCKFEGRNYNADALDNR